MVTYLHRNVTIVRGASYPTYLDLESLEIQRSGFDFKLNLSSAIGDLAYHDILASYVSHFYAMAYDTKQATQSSTVIVYDCPLSNIDARALKVHGYQTYATFHDTSMEQDVTASAQSMPMTLCFAILEFSCPKIVFLALPQCLQDGYITSFVVLILISTIFTIITTHTCSLLSYQRIKCLTRSAEGAITNDSEGDST